MGDHLGTYEILSELGRGGMGVVYKALDERLGRIVAIKELLIPHASEADRAETIERFKREAMAAARMSHPNIVTVFDYGQEETRHYMAMELLEGKNLGNYLDQKVRFSLQQVIDIAVQICSALDYAHQAGVVHRDIKPDNIMLADNGAVKLTDFGVARVKSDLPSMTTTGTTLGTIAYISPEQLCDSRMADGRSDLFSLGALIYEMLTFKTPFDAGNLGGTILNIMNAPPTPPRELNPQIPLKLESVILRALKKNPDERFARAAEMAHALQASLRGTSPLALPPDPAPSMAAETCRHCGAPRHGRVCSSCGRAGTAPLTYTLPPAPERPQGSAPAMTPPRMPAPSPLTARIPQMPSRTGPLTPPPTMPPVAAVSSAPKPSAPSSGVRGLKSVACFGELGTSHGEFQQPRCLAFDNAGNLLVADTENSRLQVFDPSRRFIKAVHPDPVHESFRYPRALAVNQHGITYVTDDLDYCIYRLDHQGHQVGIWKRMPVLDELPSIPGRLIIGPTGHLYLSEPNNRRVLVYDGSEKLLSVIGPGHGMQSPGGLAIDAAGNLLVLDFGRSQLFVFNPRFELVKTLGKRGQALGEFVGPRDIATDSAGYVYVADTLNHRIQVLDPSGTPCFAFGSQGTAPGEFNGLEALKLGPDGLLYVSDRGNGRIQVLSIERA